MIIICFLNLSNDNLLILVSKNSKNSAMLTIWMFNWQAFTFVHNLNV